MNLVAYLRVSTADKDQNPERQADVIKGFAARGGHEIVSWHTDEGVSGSTDPFQRQGFLEAIEAAKKYAAQAIVVESVDRLTRNGTQGMAMAEFFLDLDHQLRVEIADLPPGMDPFTREIITGLMAACAKEFRRRLREQIRTGIERARRNGFPNGRPGRKKKPGLTPKERAMVLELVKEGKGLDLVALELTKARGAYDVADPKAQRDRRVGPTWLWRQIYGVDTKGRPVEGHDHSFFTEVRERLAARRCGASLPKEPEKEPRGATA